MSSPAGKVWLGPSSNSATQLETDNLLLKRNGKWNSGRCIEFPFFL